MIRTLNVRSLITWAAIAAVISVVVNCALMYIGQAVVPVPPTFGPYMLSSIIGLTVLGVVLAAAGYALSHWFYGNTRKANKYFILITLVLLVISFIPDIMIPYSTDPDQVGWNSVAIGNLLLMHVATAGIIVWSFTRKSHPSR